MKLRLGILLAGLLIVHGLPGPPTHDTVTLAQGDTQPRFVSSRSPAPGSTGLSFVLSDSTGAWLRAVSKFSVDTLVGRNADFYRRCVDKRRMRMKA